jgi:hypothetical protein
MMTTLRTLLSLSWAVIVAVGVLATPASAATILSFGQSGGSNLFTGDQTGATTVLDATNIPIIITTLNEAPVTLAAFFNLDATSSGAAQQVGTTNAWVQFYTGDFQITSGLGGTGTNYLSGVFSGLQLGVINGQELVFASTEPPLSLTFTSSVLLAEALFPPRAMGLALTNVLPTVSIIGPPFTFGDFSATTAGNFSAEVIPEPMTLVLVGSGLLGLVARQRIASRADRSSACRSCPQYRSFTSFG